MRRSDGHLRSEILAVAHEALEAAGSPNQMPLRGIAGRIGISVPALYLHFSSKHDLLRAVANEALSDLCGRLEAAAASATDLTATGEAYIAYAIRQPAHYRLLAFQAVGGKSARTDDGVATLLRCLEPLVADHLQKDTAAQSSVGSPTATQLTVELFAVAHGIASMFGTWPRARNVDVSAVVRRTLCPLVQQRTSAG